MKDAESVQATQENKESSRKMKSLLFLMDRDTL